MRIVHVACAGLFAAGLCSNGVAQTVQAEVSGESLADANTAAFAAPQSLHAQTYPRAGWQAELSTLAHNVSGTATIIDADTFRVDRFTYDGGGVDVHFILAPIDSNSSFRNERLVTELNLLGMPYNNGSVTIDLPAGTTFDGYNAISLWCIPFSANFGSGTFTNTITPEPTGVLALGAFGLVARRRRS